MAEWYYAHDNQQHGPVSGSQLKQLADAGHLQPGDLVWKEGLPNWVAASSLKGLFPAAAPAPPPPAPDEVPLGEIQPLESRRPRASGADPAEVLQRHFGRGFGWDLQAMSVSPQERERLAADGITDETAQRYLGWRRSLLLLVIAPTALNALLNTITSVADGFDGLSPFGVLAMVLFILTPYALPAAAVAAALLWTRPRLSHRLVLGGWAVAFLTPVLIALCPLAWLMKADFTDMDPSFREAAEEAVGVAAGILAGFGYYVALMPTVLSLIPGMLRGSVRIKGLLPESTLPGWFLVAGAPLYALLLLVSFIAINQMLGNALLLLSILLLLAAPLLYVIRADLFIQPLTSATEKRAIGIVQWIFFGVVAQGVLLLIIYLFTKKVGATHLVGFSARTSLMRPWKILQFYLDYLGRSLFITVLAADLLLRACLAAWRIQGDFAKKEEAPEFDRRMGQLDQATRSL